MFKSFTKSIASFLLLCVFSSSTVYGWKMEENFDSQPLGAKPKYSGAGGMEWFSGTKVTNDQTYSGSGRSASLSVTKGTSGWGEFGAVVNYPSTIKEGGEVWWRVRTFMPKSYNYAADAFALKFMRTHTRAITTKNNHGFLDLYIQPNGGLLYQIEVGHEVEPGKWWGQVNESASKQSNAELAAIDPKVVLGRWETYEIYVKFSQSSGIYRVWKDGNLVYENTKWETMKSKSGSPESESELMNLFTYWNGDAPQTQTMYIDDLVVTTDKPAARDNYGNPYLGMGADLPATLSPPKPPSVN